LYDLVAREVGGMTEAQLDFCSNQWPWAEWSIRYQLSHMAFVPHMWLLVRRLKRAQGLSTNVEVPRVGYWVLDGWDHSETG
jgi:hypothetical protein